MLRNLHTYQKKQQSHVHTCTITYRREHGKAIRPIQTVLERETLQAVLDGTQTGTHNRQVSRPVFNHLSHQGSSLTRDNELTHFGKCVMTRVLFSGSILSCSAVNLSMSCLLIVRNTELRKVRPKMSVASYFCKLSQNTGTWQKLTHLGEETVQ